MVEGLLTPEWTWAGEESVRTEEWERLEGRERDEWDENEGWLLWKNKERRLNVSWIGLHACISGVLGRGV